MQARPRQSDSYLANEYSCYRMFGERISRQFYRSNAKFTSFRAILDARNWVLIIFLIKNMLLIYKILNGNLLHGIIVWFMNFWDIISRGFSWIRNSYFHLKSLRVRASFFKWIKKNENDLRWTSYNYGSWEEIKELSASCAHFHIYGKAMESQFTRKLFIHLTWDMALHGVPEAPNIWHALYLSVPNHSFIYYLNLRECTIAWFK